jgi:hypothetical protein
VVVVADGGLADAVVVEELARLAGVLAGDEVGLFEGADGAVGDVLEVADGGRDEVKGAGHSSSIEGLRIQRGVAEDAEETRRKSGMRLLRVVSASSAPPR